MSNCGAPCRVPRAHPHPWCVMPARCVSAVLQSCMRVSRPLLQGNRSLRAHGRRPPPSTAPAVTQARTFSGATPAAGQGQAESAAGDDAKVAEGFPWRGAPELVVEPPGDTTFLDGIMESVFETFCLKGVNFGAGAEAAFVTTAAAFFKMPTSKVRSPKPIEAATARAEGDGELEGKTGEEVVAAAATAEMKDKEKDEERPTETSEEEAERVLAAIDQRLVAFSNDKGGVPFYRLHRTVAKAIARRKFIFGVQRGDDLTGHFSVSMSPILDFVLEEKNYMAQIKNALAGNATVTFQIDVDLVCDETFYVKDKETGEVIQGQMESTERTHRIRLESCLLMEQTIDQPHTWKVIDLDNWLNGNAFC